MPFEIADAAPLFVEYRPDMRRRIAAAVDALVALLDQIDGDGDFEDADPPEDDAPAEDVGDNEPSLGAPGTFYFPDQAHWAQGAGDDREDDSDLLEDDGSGESALGATTAVNQQHAWAAPRVTDAIVEDEPSLGWTGHGRGHPEMALRGYDDEREQNIGADDREHDDAERSGCGDMDGVMEQHGFGVQFAE
ncbi:hypothetical protein [Methylocystis rosea]|uniref:Uncharacterized protein n=1 Tax=Methylocystis rosea TaxID=173366 RepID=A0A3G8M4P6_9HYPH|nr:hypothetical protein [Methylocystis rosea]AZG76285.1 hypothetical protein EHO51_05835 [Methylocystis rosea]